MVSVKNLRYRLQRSCKNVEVTDLSDKTCIDFRLDVPEPRKEQSSLIIFTNDTDDESRSNYHCTFRTETYRSENNKEDIRQKLRDIINISCINRDKADVTISIQRLEVLSEETDKFMYQPHVFLENPLPDEIIALSRSLSSNIDYNTFEREPGHWSE
jgi:hypothetical protein